MDNDEAIAIRFPLEWARANDPAKRGRSKARNNLRRRYRAIVELETFVSGNPSASCVSCVHSTSDPTPGIRGLTCDLDSDFHGYQMVRADHVCARWGRQS